MDTNFVTRQEKLYFRRFSNGSNLVKETFRPAGNSRVWQAMGGRNCFTITTQSLCSVRFSRAIIPTPGGEVCYSQQHLYQADKHTHIYITGCAHHLLLCWFALLSFSRSPRFWWMKKKGKRGGRGGVKTTPVCDCEDCGSPYAQQYLVLPDQSTYVVFSSFTHLPVTMSCKTHRCVITIDYN